MGWYRDRLFPHVLDWVMRQRPFDRERATTLADAAGDVLEIGFGTGLNLPYYPATVEQLTVVDPVELLPDRVQHRLAKAGRPVHIVRADAAAMPFDAARFDCVVSTFTLCSIPAVEAALAEIHRVLRPGGQLLFVEHGRSDDPRVARWQDRVNPVQRWLGGGCNLNRPIDRLITGAGLELARLERYLMPRTPRIMGEHYRGAAVRL